MKEEVKDKRWITTDYPHIIFEDNEVHNLVEKMGGKLLDFYYSFGDQDGVAIMEMPDEGKAAACVLAVTASGHLRGTKTTQLLTVEEAVKAMGSAGEQVYAGPEG